MKERTPLADRLAMKLVENDNGCHVFIGCRNAEGYGRITEGGHSGRIVYAHRVAWELKHGPIPDETPLVLHRCDNPPCCNVEHLFLGTKSTNILDYIEKQGGVVVNQYGTHPVCPTPG